MNLLWGFAFSKFWIAIWFTWTLSQKVPTRFFLVLIICLKPIWAKETQADLHEPFITCTFSFTFSWLQKLEDFHLQRFSRCILYTSSKNIYFKIVIRHFSWYFTPLIFIIAATVERFCGWEQCLHDYYLLATSEHLLYGQN